MKEYNCRFHPTDWWHEVGCPHWSKCDDCLANFFGEHQCPPWMKALVKLSKTHDQED